jgi:hypothetical protein
MRQGQQNRRGRGRNNNRKGQSPLTRSFESTGPDVKIRGTPAHIAEKYMTLSRDASSSGDPVLAENYLQHAEHYNRIIMAFREQNVGPNGEQLNGGMNRSRPYDPTDQGDDFDDDGDDGDMQPSMAPMRQEHQPQPRMDNQRFDNHRGGGNNDQQRYRDRNDRNDRNDRPERNDRNDRHDRPERQDNRPDRGGYQAAPRQQNNNNSNNNDAGPAEGGAPAPDRQPRRERFVQSTHEQPEFLRRPVRRPRRESNGAPEEANGAPIAADETDHD